MRDATVELINGASCYFRSYARLRGQIPGGAPLPPGDAPRLRGYDPGAAHAADPRSSVFRARHGGGAMSSNARTALILASIAAVFFIGVMVRHWLW